MDPVTMPANMQTCSNCEGDGKWVEGDYSTKHCTVCRGSGRVYKTPESPTLHRSLATDALVRVSATKDSLPAPNILAEADALTGPRGARNDSYDHPRHNFEKIAKCWSVILGVEVTPRQYAQCMIVMKVVRDSHKAQRDNLLDIAGYARCVERMDET